MRHASTIWAITLAFLLAPLALVVLPAGSRLSVALAWAALAGLVLARLWMRRGGRYVVFVYSNSPNWQEHVEEVILPRLPENAAILNWSERRAWPLWSVAVWAFAVLGGYREFNPIGIVFRRWRLPRVFRFWRAFRDAKHGNLAALTRVQQQFLDAAGPGPRVDLFEEGPSGAALSWTGPRARAVALRIFVELAQRLEEEPWVERLRLSGDVGEPIDVSTVEDFIRAAPALLKRLYCEFDFEFLLNEGARAYRLRHLDQSVAGMWFYTPEEGEPFWDALGEVLRDVAARSPTVAVSAAPWYEDVKPFR
jgi:hypothetical protein